MTLTEFFNRYPITEYQREEFLLHPNDIPQGINYIEKGFIRMYSLTLEGKELTVNIFKPGAFFPMIWALGEAPNIYYYQTITPLTIRRAPQVDVLQFLKNNPQELFLLTKRVLSGLHGYLIQTQYALFGTAYVRIASTILLCAKRFGIKNTDNTTEIYLPLTHQMIGNLTALTRETVTLEMQKLFQKNIITYRKRKIIVLDISKLEEIARSGFTFSHDSNII
jgi:CRP-like cAMP-binding protein